LISSSEYPFATAERISEAAPRRSLLRC